MGSYKRLIKGTSNMGVIIEILIVLILLAMFVKVLKKINKKK